MFLFLENTAFILKLKRFQTEAWQSWMHAILAQWQLLRSNCKGYIGSDFMENKFSGSLKYSSHLNTWMIKFTVLKSDNLHCYTLGCCVNWTIVSSTKHLTFQVLFSFIISCKILYIFFFLNFFYIFTKIKIKSLECPKSKPAN